MQNDLPRKSFFSLRCRTYLRNDEHSCTTENGAPAAVSQRMDREQRSEAKGPFSLAPFQSQSGFSLEVEEVSEIVDGEAAFIRSGCR